MKASLAPLLWLALLVVGCGAGIAPEGPQSATAGDWYIDDRAATLGVSVERVECQGGCWRLTRAEFQDETQSGGTHHIYIKEPHDLSLYGEVTNGVETWLVHLEKPTNEPAGNHAMSADNVYSARMHGADSDSIHGMRMRGPDEDSWWQAHHVSWLLTFEWTEAEAPTHRLYLPVVFASFAVARYGTPLSAHPTAPV